jgi:hypothetical protein
MRLHAKRKNLAASAPDHEPSACALDSFRSLPLIATLRLRWSPVVSSRETPSISFFLMPLRDFFFHNDRGTPTPHIESSSPKRRRLLFPVQPLTSNIQSLSPFLATHAKFRPASSLVATDPKTQVLKVLCLPHIQKLAGVGGILLTRNFRKDFYPEEAERLKDLTRFPVLVTRRLRTCTKGQSDRLGEYRTPKESKHGEQSGLLEGEPCPALEPGKRSA